MVTYSVAAGGFLTILTHSTRADRLLIRSNKTCAVQAVWIRYIFVDYLESQGAGRSIEQCPLKARIMCAVFQSLAALWSECHMTTNQLTFFKGGINASCCRDVLPHVPRTRYPCSIGDPAWHCRVVVP